MKRIICPVFAIALMSNTATNAETIDTSKVRIVTENQRSNCKYLGLVSVRKALGQNKLKGAFKKAMNEVAELGGNGLYVVAQQLDWAEGAQLTGEALLCSFEQN